MSDKEGRQSPPPSRQSDAQVGQGSNAKTKDSKEHPDGSKKASQQQKETKLESNPKAPLDDEVKTKLR